MNKAKLIVRKVTFGWSHQKRCQAQQRELHFILIRVGTLHSIKNRYAAELCPKVLAISMVKLNVARHKKNALKSADPLVCSCFTKKIYLCPNESAHNLSVVDNPNGLA